MTQQSGASPSAIWAKAQPIIDRYSGICRPEYYDNLERCISALQNAAKAIEDAEAILRCCPIDDVQWVDASDMPWMSDQPRDRHELQQQMRADAGRFNSVAMALNVASYADRKNKSGRAVPADVYIQATKELMTVFEEQTQTPVVFPDPRQVHQGQSTQPSTHFIHQCLQQIDPLCDLRMTMTCIRKVRDFGKIPGTDVREGDLIFVDVSAPSE